MKQNNCSLLQMILRINIIFWYVFLLFMFVLSIYVDFNRINTASENFVWFFDIIKYVVYLSLIIFVVIVMIIYFSEFSSVSRRNNFFRFLFLILFNLLGVFIVAYYYANPQKSLFFKKRESLSFWGWDSFPSLDNLNIK
jgi:hypothetical protein